MELDIEKIMEDIRNEIKERGETSDILSFEEIPFETMQAETGDKFSINNFNENVDIANRIYMVQAYRPLAGNKLFVFIKKVIRKLTKFYVEPIVNDQNNFNVSILRSMNSVRSYINDHHVEDASLKEINDSLKIMELKINELQKKVDKIN